MVFIESIKYHKSLFANLTYHQQRFDATRKHFFPKAAHIDLKNNVVDFAPQDSKLYKCRVLYGENIHKIEFVPYKTKLIYSLKIIYNDTISYDFKYQDRTQLDLQYQQRGVADDILLVKKGNITDSYYANVAFSDGKKWYTPASPLLKGTQRAFLLDQKAIEETDITLRDLFKFKSIKLINAMLDWDSPYEIPMDNIY